jgi:hypothetical protein
MGGQISNIIWNIYKNRLKINWIFSILLNNFSQNILFKKISSIQIQF